MLMLPVAGKHSSVQVTGYPYASFNRARMNIMAIEGPGNRFNQVVAGDDAALVS